MIEVPTAAELAALYGSCVVRLGVAKTPPGWSTDGSRLMRPHLTCRAGRSSEAGGRTQSYRCRISLTGSPRREARGSDARGSVSTSGPASGGSHARGSVSMPALQREPKGLALPWRQQPRGSRGR